MSIKKQNKTEFLNILTLENYNAVRYKGLELTPNREFWAVKTSMGWIYGLSSKAQAKSLEVL